MGQPFDVLTLGEAMVSFHTGSSWREGGAATTRVAGAESNVAIALARLGHRVGWVGRVGADPFGQLVRRELRAESVDVEHVVVDPTRPTGLMFVEHRTADLVRVEYRRDCSASSALGAADVDAALAAGCRLLHLTGITPALSTGAHETVWHAARTAREHGATVSLDVNFRGRLWSRDEARRGLRSIVELVDVLVASDDELDLVADGDEATAVAQLLDRGVAQVAVKRGAHGATLWTREARHDVPVFPVTAVDPLGAGDAFSAGLVSGLLDGLDDAARLRRAAALGAFAVSSHGDWQGLPRRDELQLVEALRPGSPLR